jgi:hypothetical protein
MYLLVTFYIIDTKGEKSIELFGFFLFFLQYSFCAGHTPILRLYTAAS